MSPVVTSPSAPSPPPPPRPDPIKSLSLLPEISNLPQTGRTKRRWHFMRSRPGYRVLVIREMRDRKRGRRFFFNNFVWRLTGRKILSVVHRTISSSLARTYRITLTVSSA